MVKVLTQKNKGPVTFAWNSKRGTLSYMWHPMSTWWKNPLLIVRKGRGVCRWNDQGSNLRSSGWGREIARGGWGTQQQQKFRHMVYKRGRRKEKRSNAYNYIPQGMDRRALGGMVIISLGHLGCCVISHFMQGLYEWLHVVLVRLDSKIVDQWWIK